MVSASSWSPKTSAELSWPTSQVSLPFPPDVSDAQRMPVVHLDANCHPGRARPDNVMARNQVTDVRFGSNADIERDLA